MQEEIKEDARDRMAKSVVALEQAFAKIRTGRAHPACLMVSVLRITAVTRR